MKYRKKPVVIEAALFGEDNYKLVMSFCPELELLQHPHTMKMHGMIPTLEGLMEVQEGDYIIKGVKGEFYPCKPDIFEMTYQPETTNLFLELYEQIKHGDQEHQDWLRDKILKFIEVNHC